MMASATVYDAVRGYLEAQFTAAPLVWENEGAGQLPAPFIIVELVGDVTAQTSIGSGDPGDNRWLESGSLYLYVMVDAGTGSREARALAQHLIDLFRGLSLLADSLRFQDMSVGLGQPGDENGLWWQLPMSIRWEREF